MNDKRYLKWYNKIGYGSGDIEVSFPGPVEAGVLDHDVALPDGTVVHNPLRVLRNDAGSEVVFTLYRRLEMTAEEFDADAAAERGQSIGDGTPVHITIPTPNPWVPIRILGR